MERRLAAVLAADPVGRSRMVFARLRVGLGKPSLSRFGEADDRSHELI